MIYIRGQPEDYDHWAQLGNRGWSWDDVPALFQARPSTGRASTAKCTARTGRCSPRTIATGRRSAQAVIEAGRQLGLEYREDVNDLPPGAGDEHRLVPADPRRPAPRQRRAHLSAPGAEAAEPAARHRARWCIACCSTATRATGVEFSRSGGTSSASMRRAR